MKRRMNAAQNLIKAVRAEDPAHCGSEQSVKGRKGARRRRAASPRRDSRGRAGG